jgi:SAM-dependent methyltransferase
VGSPQWFQTQRRIILSRPLVRRTYDRWYQSMLADARSVAGHENAPILEIGSGSGYIGSFDASIITSDIVPGSAGRIIDAQSLPFADESLRAIFLTHVFHHIPDVRRFLREAQRTLVVGGVISIIDIARTPLARLLFGHDVLEDYYTTPPGEWHLDERRRAEGANQALAWIVFERDRRIFETEFPDLSIECREHLPWFGYLCSGGVTRRSLVPSAVAGVVERLDRLAETANSLCSLHCHIRLRKRDSQRPDGAPKLVSPNGTTRR